MRKTPCATAGLSGPTSPNGSSRHRSKTTTNQSRHLEQAAMRYIIESHRPTRDLILDALGESEPLTTRDIANRCGVGKDHTRHTLADLLRTGLVRRVRFRENVPGSRWEIGYLRLPPESIAARPLIIR